MKWPANRVTGSVKIIIVFFALSLFSPSLTSAESVPKDPAKTLANPLRSYDERRQALEALLKFPGQDLHITLTQLLQNDREKISFRHMIADGLVRLNTDDAKNSVRRLLFDYRADSFSRQISLSMLWRMIPEGTQKEAFKSEMLQIARDQRELPQLRTAAIGYLANDAYISKNNPDWAQKILVSPSNPVPVRTAALTFMEMNQYDELIAVIPTIMLDVSEDRNFRQITILKAARLYSKELTPHLKIIASNQKNNFEIRKLALALLVDDIYAKDLALFFNEMLRSEKDPRMKVEIEEAVGDLAKHDEMVESLSL